jgi:hypothetical protein
MGLSNLVFYTCLHGVQSQRERDDLLASARTLRDLAREHREAVNLSLTYCTVAFEYGANAEKEEACEIAAAVTKAPYAREPERETGAAEAKAAAASR